MSRRLALILGLLPLAGYAAGVALSLQNRRHCFGCYHRPNNAAAYAELRRKAECAEREAQAA